MSRRKLRKQHLVPETVAVIVHECGHAMVALAVGCSVDWIMFRAGDYGRTYFAIPPDYQLPLADRYRSQMTPLQQKLLCNMMVGLGGHIAQDMWGPEAAADLLPDGDESDFQSIHELDMLLGGNAIEGAGLVARGALRAHWHNMERLVAYVRKEVTKKVLADPYVQDIVLTEDELMTAFR